MRYISKYLFPVILSVLVVSCSKNSNTPQVTASLTLVDAVVGNNKLMMNFSGNYSFNIGDSTSSFNYYNAANSVSYSGQYNAQTYYVFNNWIGRQKLALYQWPDTLPKSQPLFNFMLDLPVGSINSLFLTGTATSPDTLFTTDRPPYHPISDSVTGIRFINLSSGSNPISVNIRGEANGSEVSSLPYKGLTSFISYPATTSAADTINFEFRDAASGTLLTTFQI